MLTISSLCAKFGQVGVSGRINAEPILGRNDLKEGCDMPDLLVKLYDLPDSTTLISSLEKDRIRVRRAMAYEKHLAVNWVRDNFGTRWASECDISFANQPISCFLATRDGQILGFACYDSTCKDFFGPAGVLPAHRERGIGKGLLLVCLSSMREQGYAYAIVGAAGPQEFYAKTVGAIEIPGSTPGVYRDWLTE
jgi:GNAT superfamily N-acetyltransferase